MPQRYGELAPAAPQAAAGRALASSMALVDVCHNGKTLQKKLPGEAARVWEGREALGRAAAPPPPARVLRVAGRVSRPPAHA